MKRHGSSDSLGALISMCPISEEHSPRSNHRYQSMLDGLENEGCIEESWHIPGKKRRLSVDQVKGLEKNFEVENKLEPDRKVKLAQELGLQPRQVAVWFQNRRARWKTKQLERDYGVLKANFDCLKQNFDSLQHDKDSLLNKIKVLKSKLKEENTESNLCIKEEALISDSNNNQSIEPVTPQPSLSEASGDAKLLNKEKVLDLKDGPSESDSSAILNEDNNNNNSSPNASNSSNDGGFLYNQEQMVFMSPNSPSLRFNCSSSSLSSTNCFSFTESRSKGLESENNPKDNVYHPQFVKLEEHNVFSGEEACNLFSDEAAPTFHWYCPDQWDLIV